MPQPRVTGALRGAPSQSGKPYGARRREGGTTRGSGCLTESLAWQDDDRKEDGMGQELVEFSIEPKTFEEAMKYAELIAKSTLVPKDYQGQPGNVLIAIQWGREIGLKPLQALQNIAVINGRPCLWGDAVLAMVRGSGLVEDYREDFHEATFTATCTIKRKGQPSPIVRTFSRADAERAGLWDRNTWKSYPKRMAQMRARAFALRDGFADVLKGIAISEEQQDVETNGQALLPPPEPPRRLSETRVAAPDPITEWEQELTFAKTLGELTSLWARLCPATKDGFYHTLPQEQQARLLAAKNQRKQELGDNGHPDADAPDRDAA